MGLHVALHWVYAAHGALCVCRVMGWFALWLVECAVHTPFGRKSRAPLVTAAFGRQQHGSKAHARALGWGSGKIITHRQARAGELW